LLKIFRQNDEELVAQSRSFAEVLYLTSKIDSQLELKEKHYDKVSVHSV
jgi:hypothetical protein